MERQEIVTRTATQYLDEHGIFRVTILPGAEQTLDDAKENVRASLALSGGERHPLLVDIRQIKSQTRDARDYYTGPAGDRCYSAAAVLVESPLSRFFGNIIMSFNKSVAVESRLFSSESEALAWLKTCLES